MMNGIQILLDHRGRSAEGAARPMNGSAHLGALDVLVDGFNVTARVGEGQTLPFLRDLAFATADLASGKRTRATVGFYQEDDAWELGLERDGADLLLTVFRGGKAPEVAVFERRASGPALADGVLRALAEGRALRDAAELPELAYAESALAAASFGELASPPRVTSGFEGTEGGPLSFGYEVTLPQHGGRSAEGLERNDLHSLLVRGRLRLLVRERARDLDGVHLFLVAERLVAVCEEVLRAAAVSAAFYRRFDVGGARMSVRMTTASELVLSVRPLAATRGAVGESFPSLDPGALARATLSLGRALARTLSRHDRSQLSNLRFLAFRAALKRLGDSLSLGHEGTRLNDAPESYRAYAAASQRPEPVSAPRGRLKFSPRWTATAAGIDLRSTFLCGERLLVGTRTETACLDRASGSVVWRRPTVRACAVPTPGGLSRIHADGTVELLDFGTGDRAFVVKVAPRVGFAPTGAVVHAPGLPRLLVVTEGERSLSAIDLVSGEVRWRRTAARGGPLRVRRAGKLLVEVAGEPHLTAVDVQSGEVVWKLRTPQAMLAAPTFDKDALFALTGDGSGAGARLLSVDAWSGQERFAAPLPRGVGFAGSPLVTESTVFVILRDGRGLGLAAYHRSTGELVFSLEPGLAPPVTAWLVLDGSILANTEEGDLFAVDGGTGETRFRLSLTRGAEDPLPRSLEPVLRSGALFVPQKEVHVIRPRDGERLGTVPCEIVPDLLRVDERCDVYVAEESGHLAAYSSGPHLSLVR